MILAGNIESQKEKEETNIKKLAKEPWQWR